MDPRVESDVHCSRPSSCHATRSRLPSLDPKSAQDHLGYWIWMALEARLRALACALLEGYHCALLETMCVIATTVMVNDGQELASIEA